eukprot:3936664-Rhodomonas_salina.3
MRYKSFSDTSALHNFLVKRVPERIELGAVYSERPDQKLLCPVFKEKEFVIDIDLTDFGSIFSTQNDPGDASFPASWTFLVTAIILLDRLLREDFGFQQLLWVWSGMKGVHCWVADERARVMPKAAREAVTSYLQFHRPESEQKADGMPLDLPFQRAVDTLVKLELFDKMLIEQEWLRPDRRECVLKVLPDEELRKEVERALDGVAPDLKGDQKFLWKTLRSVLKTPRNETSRRKARKSKWKRVDIAKNITSYMILHLCYPVLDANVSKAPCHLLKIPFAVHPKTNYISVPLNVQEITEMDPSELPTLKKVCDNSASLRPFVDFFRKEFVQPLHMRAVRAIIEQQGL